VNPERLRQAPHIAIVGSTSPLGRELRETLESSGFPAGKISLIETEEYAGLLQEFAGEIEITQILRPDAFTETDIAFFACSPEIISAYASSGSRFPELTIDLTQTGREGTLFLRGVSDPSLLRGAGYYINPHPVAIVLGRLFARLQSAFQVESASVTILVPASERGLGSNRRTTGTDCRAAQLSRRSRAKSSAAKSRSICFRRFKPRVGQKRSFATSFRLCWQVGCRPQRWLQSRLLSSTPMLFPCSSN
jgi:aspartate-semialdehyde dehydrogenase